MKPELSLSQHLAITQEMKLGTELFWNFRRKVGAGVEPPDLTADLNRIKKQLFDTGWVVICAAGAGNSAKGGLLKGLELELEEPSFQEVLRAQGYSDSLVISHPFSMSMEATKLPGVPSQFRVSPDRNPATYSFDDTDRGSNYQLHLLEQHLLPRKGRPNTATAVVLEGSTPLIYPTSSNLPAEYRGFSNLGLSTIFSLALSDSESTFLYLLDRSDPRVHERGMEYRRAITDGTDPFTEYSRHVLPTPDGGMQYITDLNPEQIENYRRYTQKTQASPAGVDRNDLEFARFISALRKEDHIKRRTATALFKFLLSRLPLPKKNTGILDNEYMGLEQTNPAKYFAHSLAARVHPELNKELYWLETPPIPS